MKTSYTATLSNGTVVTRKSERTYTHYWRVICQGDGFSYAQGGFAGSLDLARKSKSSAEAYCNKHSRNAVVTSDLVEATTT
jgi:hypothetical protein